MSDAEPENVTLVHLRAIRATLDDHTARFDRLDAGIVTLRDGLERLEARLERVDTLQLMFNVIVDLNARLTRLENQKA